MPSVSTTFTTFGTAARSGSFGFAESWGTPAHAQSVDTNRATYTNGFSTPWPDGYTFYLTARQLSGLVPAGATVDGIRATVTKRRASGVLGSWKDSAVFVIKGGTVQTAQNKATATNYTTSDVGETYGGPTDKWGQTWSAAEINGAGFGIAVSCACAGLDLEDADAPEINAITVEVFYTEAGNKGDLMLSGSGD